MKTAAFPFWWFLASGLSCLFCFFLILIPDKGTAQFQRNFGNSLDNSFSKVIQDGSNFYVLGQNEPSIGALNRATVTRLDANGMHQWTLSLSIASVWNDAVLTPTGDLLVVGYSLPFDPTTQSLMGRITPSGSFSWVRAYNQPGRDAFWRIVRNPVSQNPAFPYYVVGTQNQPSSTTTTEDVVLFNLDANGTFNWKKIYGSTGDDEFFRDLEALPGSGDLLLVGNDSRGLIFRTDNTGNAFTGVTISGIAFTDVARRSAGGFYASANGFGASGAHVLKFDDDLLLQWDVIIPELIGISQVWEASTGIYVTGTGIFGGQSRTVIVKLLDNGPTVAWVKYLNSGGDVNGGSSWFLPSSQLAYTDERVIPDGFGGTCAFISVSDLELTTCNVSDVTVSLVFSDPFPDGPTPPTIDFQDVPMGTNLLESVALNWLQGAVCSTDPCEVTISITPINNCSLVQVCANATGSGPYAYQWCDGQTSQCITTQIPDCSPFEFCVSVTCSDGLVASAGQTYTVSDDTPPLIVCPSDVLVTSTNPDSCTIQVNNLQLISATDNCAFQITYEVTGATSATGQNDASGLIFNLGVSTVTYTAIDNCGNISTCSFTVTVNCEDSCEGNLAQNPNFNIGAVSGPLPAPGMLNSWQVAYGTPVISNDFGCLDPGYVQLDGNKTSGSAIYQQLATPIEKGKVYELSVCVRVLPPVPYAKLRAVAFNNPLPTDGTHPAPDQDIAIIDVSGRIPCCDDWTKFVFHRWKGGKSYSNIAIIVENNEPGTSSLVSIADIDNICFVEVNDSIPCYLAEIDSLGNPIPPFGQLDPDFPIFEDSIDMFMGYVNDLYAYCDPAPNGIDTWYETCPDSCESIGGELPDELIDFIEDDSLNQYLLDSIGVNDSTLMADLENFLDSLELATPNENMLDSITALGALAINCRSLPPKGSPPIDPESPFNGCDIIFVHGLRPESLQERALFQNTGSQTTWPTDRNEFYNGYWKRGAYAYWNLHTNKYLKTTVDPNNFAVLRNGNYSNRYLVVSHPATQSFAYGAHTVLEQIAKAMLDGTGVINCKEDEARPTNTFGHNGFIIISHSDGAPLTDIVLTTSDLSRYPPLSFMLGDVSFIADRCDLHVALQGAFGGSNYAALALIAAKTTTGPYNVLPLVEPFLGFPVNSGLNWLYTSQVLDMAITKHLWGDFMEQVPVCVLTLTGGHPSDFSTDLNNVFKYPLSLLVKHNIHHGFDDGVLSIESQSANRDSRLRYPSVYFPKPGKLSIINHSLNEKLYDMGIHKDRGIRYYLDQKMDIISAGDPLKFPYASSGCIPWLSPTGMVQPVLFPRIEGIEGFDPLNRYENHYSFIQSTADHLTGSNIPYFISSNYDATYETGAANYEESRVITSEAVYSDCGVSPAMRNLQVEYIRGRSVTFTIKFFKRRWTFTRWIWKRKYHLLDKHDQKNQLDYLYENVLK